MRLGRLLTSALTTAVLAATLAGGLAPADAATTDAPFQVMGGQFTVTTNGFGHGRGMSQYGAYGRAQAGQSAAAILDFYYAGTTASRVAGALRVRVSDTARFVTVKPARTLRVHAVGGRTYRIGHRGVTAWRLVPYSARTAVQYKARGHWHRYRFVPGTTNEFLSGAGKLVLVTPAGPKAYRGRIRSAQGTAVNVVSLEAYLRGVVAAEMPASWSAQALQAQAVAARTYAWYAKVHAGSRSYDICDTTACQVYGGVARETATTNAAVAATSGRILLLAGTAAFTEFSASNGGETAGWLTTPPQADPYDTAYRNQQVTASAATIGSPTSITLTRDASGRVTTATLAFASGTSQAITGDAFRSAYGLRSTLFTLS